MHFESYQLFQKFFPCAKGLAGVEFRIKYLEVERPSDALPVLGSK